MVICSTFEIASESNLAGKLCVSCIKREPRECKHCIYKERRTYNSDSNKLERLFPGDEICVIGTDEQVE
jgi:CPA2 family monovalent cation:H+ antiporter-2